MPRFEDMHFGQKFGEIEITAASGDQTLVTGVAGKKIRVHSMEFLTDTATTISMKSATTTIGGVQTFAANGGKVLGFNEAGWMETAEGEALVMNVGTASTVGGTLTYSEVE